MLNEITSCEVCKEKALTKVLDLGLHPMCDDLVPMGDERVCKEYPIEILFCPICLTAHQRFQIEKKELFPKSYHYRSRHTEDVLNGMRSLVASCEIYDLPGKKVLDIGCNDGSLLSIFAEKKAKTYGIEPTDAFRDALANHHTVMNEFFCEATAKDIVQAHGQFDLIVFTNVFAHIENLSEVIAGLKILMHDRTVIVIENHYLGAVLDKFQFDTFYHEHPRTYSLTSFIYIAKMLDCQIDNVEFPSRYNGNIRVTLTAEKNKKVSNDWQLVQKKEQSFNQDFLIMRERLDTWCVKTRDFIQSQVKVHGKLQAKAFPGRAAIPIKLLGLDENLIEAIYEKPSSAKINHYVPGTRIPILSDDLFNASKSPATPVINFAWHISGEINTYLRRMGFTGTILDIISDTP